MSRVGIKPITLPKGVEISVNDSAVTAKGPKGTLHVALKDGIAVAVNDGKVEITRPGDDKFARAMHGTIRALVNNAVLGVSEGWMKKLEIVGVGFRAQLQGSKLVLNIGFCHTVEFDAPEGISFKCPDQTTIEISGADRQAVGQMAAQIRAVRKPEPYKGKGICHSGEYVRRKAGKSAK